MTCSLSRVLTARCKRSALIRALAAIALFVTLAASASAATPLIITGEQLSGTGTWKPVSGTFNVSGTATGPYPGSFIESGSFGVSVMRGGGGWYGPAWFTATFSITSGGVPLITGTMSGRGMGFHCGPVGCYVYELMNLATSFALTGNYSGGGAAGWPVSGALVNLAKFRTDTLQASINESFAP